MSDDVSFDFLSYYKSISNKLKKRFLRKTNAAEPSDQFAALAIQCDKSDLPEYSALSWIGVATCEASLNHTTEEVTAYSNAGRHFLLAESKTLIGCGQLAKAGEWCLKEGKKCSQFKNEDDSPRLGVLMNLPLLSHQPLQTPHLRLHSLESAASYYLSLGHYEKALNVFTEIVTVVNSITSNPFGVYKDILLRCELSRVLLVLLLGPTPQRLPPPLAKLIDKYTWIGEPDKSTKQLLGEELYLVVQCVVLAWQSCDTDTLAALEPSLAPYLSLPQQLLLTAITNSLPH